MNAVLTRCPKCDGLTSNREGVCESRFDCTVCGDSTAAQDGDCGRKLCGLPGCLETWEADAQGDYVYDMQREREIWGD